MPIQIQMFHGRERSVAGTTFSIESSFTSVKSSFFNNFSRSREFAWVLAYEGSSLSCWSCFFSVSRDASSCANVTWRVSLPSGESILSAERRGGEDGGDGGEGGEVVGKSRKRTTTAHSTSSVGSLASKRMAAK
jgi:hypothetical protein